MNLNITHTTWGLILIIGLFIGFTILSGITETFIVEKNQINTTGSVVPKTIDAQVNWHRDPAKQFVKLMHEFGLPDIIDVNQGGLAVWKKSTLNQRGFCWDNVTLSDASHYFVHFSYHFPMCLLQTNADIYKGLNEINTFHPAIKYDQITQTINAVADSPQQAVVLLLLAKRLLKKELTLQQVKNLFWPMLVSINPKSNSYDPEAYNKFKIELCSLGLPNQLSSEIFLLRPGGAPKPVRNTDVLNASSP